MTREDLTIESVPLDALTPYARNARTHTDAQIAQVAASIREFGFVNPVLVDEEHTIIAGHCRVSAARKLGLAEVPTIRLAGLTAAQRKALALADNRLALDAAWDEEMLKLELADLRDAGFDLDLTGFNAGELADLDLTIGDTAPDDSDVPEPDLDRAEELREKWQVEPGQLWRLGEHRLLCGDSTNAADVARVMDGERAVLCFTSPPYAQQRDYTAESRASVSDWDALMRGVFANVPMTDDGQVLVNLGLIHHDNEWHPYWDGWIAWMREQGWRRFGWYVWDQMHGLRGDWNGRLSPSHEFVFHFNRRPVRPNKWVECIHAGETGGALRSADGSFAPVTSDEIQTHKIPDSVFRIQRQKGGVDGHPAPFSVPLVTAVMRSWDGLVYEPFSGSGTTILACERLGRACRAIEISPGYVAVALERWVEGAGGDRRCTGERHMDGGANGRCSEPSLTE